MTAFVPTPVLKTLTASMRCVTLLQLPIPPVNTAMLIRMPVCQGAQMTAFVPQSIPSVDMVVDLTYVAAVLMKTVPRTSCVTYLRTSATPSLSMVARRTVNVHLKCVMSPGLTTPVTGVMMVPVNQAALITPSVRLTNQSVAQEVSLIGVDVTQTLTATPGTSAATMSASPQSVRTMQTARMVSVMSTILPTI